MVSLYIRYYSSHGYNGLYKDVNISEEICKTLKHSNIYLKQPDSKDGSIPGGYVSYSLSPIDSSHLTAMTYVYNSRLLNMQTPRNDTYMFFTFLLGTEDMKLLLSDKYVDYLFLFGDYAATKLDLEEFDKIPDIVNGEETGNINFSMENLLREIAGEHKKPDFKKTPVSGDMLKFMLSSMERNTRYIICSTPQENVREIIIRFLKNIPECMRPYVSFNTDLSSPQELQRAAKPKNADANTGNSFPSLYFFKSKNISSEFLDAGGVGRTPVIFPDYMGPYSDSVHSLFVHWFERGDSSYTGQLEECGYLSGICTQNMKSERILAYISMGYRYLEMVNASLFHEAVKILNFIGSDLKNGREAAASLFHIAPVPQNARKKLNKKIRKFMPDIAVAVSKERKSMPLPQNMFDKLYKAAVIVLLILIYLKK